MSISEKDIENARQAWGNALIAISAAFEEGGVDQARKLAEEVLDAAYGYHLGPVLFKPTLSGGEKTFRTTKKGALSYFVGHDEDYPDDRGFAIRGWREVRSTTAAIFIEDDVAMWMGNFTFIDKDGNVTFVDKSFGYKKDETGKMRTVLHHSSLPYSAE